MFRMNACPTIITPGIAALFEPTHWTEPRLENAVIGLDAVVGILIGAMPGRW